MTEREKMLAGEGYHSDGPELRGARERAAALCLRLNQIPTSQTEDRRAVLEELLGTVGQECTIMPNFFCDYGENIRMGSHVYINYNCVILDCAPVTIGDHVLIAPNCGLYTAGHPLDADTRASGLEYAHPITIGDDVWLGANVSVLPGVTIGHGSVIGAGSVVNRDIPPNTLAAGNPCRPIRTINQESSVSI